MSDIKFSCGSCGQHISCDGSYAGAQINCPNCQAPVVIPGAAVPEAPPVPVAPKGLSIRAHHPASSSPPADASAGAAGQSCPGCRAPLAAGAVMCMSCGYNLQTGQRIAAASGRPTAPPLPARRGDDGGEKTWYIVLGVVCAVLVVLLVVGLKNESAALAYAALSNLFYLIVSIVVIVDAFRQSVGKGLMTMCVPFYVLYYLFGVCERDRLKVYFVVSAVAMLAANLLKFAPGAAGQ